MNLYLKTTADAMVGTTIGDCLAGLRVEMWPKDPMWETLNYQTGMSEVRSRIMTNPVRPLNPVVAVARFAWLIAGNNRVEDIAYYEPKVRGFSDDGLTVPGSDYGMRLMQPRPGLNQIQGVVDRLRESPSSRQAAAVVWQPEDAVRESRDIPCTFGMFFSIRPRTPVGPEELLMTVIMRSNNAFRILPFNIFEFTMLQELVAAELHAPVGAYTHWASSMHVYENDREWEPTVALGKATTFPDPIFMAPMPFGGRGGALGQASRFAQLEAKCRHSKTAEELLDIVDEANRVLEPYWVELLGPLVCWSAARMDLPDPPYYIVAPYWRSQTQEVCQKAYPGIRQEK